MLFHAWRSIVSVREDILGVLLILLGACIGSSVTIAFFSVRSADTVVFDIADVASPVPTVVIAAAAPGRVEGYLTGSGRLLLGDRLVAAGSGSFSGFMQGSLPVVVDVPVPPGMRFVASRNGKKYYAVDSGMGNRLLPKNRVYFPDRASAEAAGYKP